ncbi:hypothetical protein [Paenibacillus durus]|uniref:hypothetical protein n=1 Tax=Paenibacillus durus TaxID=44251 RepID=UPI000A515097|nr:hypothetical protein [Paenibacillus durus]
MQRVKLSATNYSGMADSDFINLLRAITEYPEKVIMVINQVLSAKSLNSSGGRTV